MRTCGTVATYNAGCRCLDCKAASKTKRRIYRARLAAARTDGVICWGCGYLFPSDRSRSNHAKMHERDL